MLVPERKAIFEQLVTVLQELFEIEPANVTLDTKLYEELDLDSIDAVDLIVHLKKLTGRHFNPEQFKSIRTVGDVVEVIYLELQTPVDSAS